MTQIATGALNAAWGLLVGWILPTAVALALFGIVVMPSLDGAPFLAYVRDREPGDQTAILVASAVVLGLVLSALETPLYRVLEGYRLWPKRLQEKRTAHHRTHRARLKQEAKAAGAGTVEPLPLKAKLLLDQHLRYPDNDAEVAPTLLGNGIRRMEYYAQDRYAMDSQRMWYHLKAVVPEQVAKEVDTARTGADFFVCGIYVLVLLVVSAIAALCVSPGDWLRLVLTVALCGVAVVVAYRSAVTATDAWAAAVRAMVDLGRKPLAESLGLRLPATFQEERRMWAGIGTLLGYPYDDRAADLVNGFRSEPEVDREPQNGAAPAEGAAALTHDGLAGHDRRAVVRTSADESRGPDEAASRRRARVSRPGGSGADR